MVYNDIINIRVVRKRNVRLMYNVYIRRRRCYYFFKYISRAMKHKLFTFICTESNKLKLELFRLPYSS